MSVLTSTHNPIRHIVIYAGHRGQGLYGDSVQKKEAMFSYLNKLRAKPWTIETVDGDKLISCLKEKKVKKTLLVIPAGTSTQLQSVFTTAQTRFLREKFFAEGGRGDFTCGSAYWVSEKRMFKDLCHLLPGPKQVEIKTTNLPLFHGLAHGPLCPYVGEKYKVSFFTDAVRVTDGKNECSIYLSGGGGFILPEKLARGEKVAVLLRYCHSELKRYGISEEEIPIWENAAVMTSVGKGIVLLSMFHADCGPGDIDLEACTTVFPDSGTDWRKVKNTLTPLEARMQFIYHSLISRLEKGDFSSIEL